jgi:hypothetical protein
VLARTLLFRPEKTKLGWRSQKEPSGQAGSFAVEMSDLSRLLLTGGPPFLLSLVFPSVEGLLNTASGKHYIALSLLLYL